MDSDSEDDFLFLLAASALALRKKPKKKNRTKRKLWIHPIVMERNKKGYFNTIYKEICEDPENCLNFTRMSKESYQELLLLIQEPCTKANTIMRDSISVQEKLLITLRYLTTGCSFVDLLYAFRIGKSTASLIVQEVCKALWAHVRQMAFPVLNAEKWMEIA
ncbi:uncharacterized protein LOC126736352 [Anthonomus grandis grandis]|uniref:uncharacterized protein LOC126736352 n=1 Tax=Anthonomus grandis grandis TaxID=2921223 RepID=UPI0021662A0B|nr:uncharacterized protein LOC126736352 [Anthonomus grandis grandis]